jgi:hypothetical protein
MIIDKNDVVVAIDPDGKSGFKPVTAGSVVQLLRGDDMVGSHVVLQIQKPGSNAKYRVDLRRADFRSVERIKECYLKLAELEVEAKTISKKVGVEGLCKLLSELQAAVELQTDWAAMVEEGQRSHICDLEALVALSMSEKEAQTQRCAELEDELAQVTIYAPSGGYNKTLLLLLLRR